MTGDACRRYDDDELLSCARDHGHDGPCRLYWVGALSSGAEIMRLRAECERDWNVIDGQFAHITRLTSENARLRAELVAYVEAERIMQEGI